MFFLSVPLSNMAWAHGISVMFWTTISPEETFLLWEKTACLWGSQAHLGQFPLSGLGGWAWRPYCVPLTGSNHRDNLKLSKLIIRPKDWPQMKSFCNSGTLYQFLLSTSFSCHLLWNLLHLGCTRHCPLLHSHLQSVFLLGCSPLPFCLLKPCPNPNITFSRTFP